MRIRHSIIGLLAVGCFASAGSFRRRDLDGKAPSDNDVLIAPKKFIIEIDEVYNRTHYIRVCFLLFWNIISNLTIEHEQK